MHSGNIYLHILPQRADSHFFYTAKLSIGYKYTQKINGADIYSPYYIKRSNLLRKQSWITMILLNIASISLGENMPNNTP